MGAAKAMWTPGAGLPSSSTSRTMVSSESSAFLEREDADAGVADVGEREGLAERARVRRGGEGAQRVVEPVGLPVGLGLAPAGGVAGEGEGELVVAPVLVGLVGVAAGAAVGGRAYAGGAQQREPDGVVGGLVGAVLGFGEEGYAVRAGLVGEVDPAVGEGFELAVEGVRALDGADVLVVGGVGVGGGECEGGFEIDGLLRQSMRLANSTRLPASPAASEMVWTNFDPQASRVTSSATRTGPDSTMRICAGPPT